MRRDAGLGGWPSRLGFNPHIFTGSTWPPAPYNADQISTPEFPSFISVSQLFINPNPLFELLLDTTRFLRFRPRPTMTFPLMPVAVRQMSNREDSVYLAKLAEQAERYEGESISFYPHSIPRTRRYRCSRWEPVPVTPMGDAASRTSRRDVHLQTADGHNVEMVENMKSVASSDQELTVEERNLLSVAYKNVIGARRASWRIVSSIEQKEESKGNETQVAMIKMYREKIEAELAKICEDILMVLDKHLIPSAASGESKVFYHKM